jgi:hypothetical protein
VLIAVAAPMIWLTLALALAVAAAVKRPCCAASD